MSEHDHSAFVEGCYRCDLSRDEMSDEDRVKVTVYTVSRWDCDRCGEVHESDADLSGDDECDSCGQKVVLR